MNKEVRTVVYDEELRIEACRFKGIVQPFPNHFHAYYVIGYMESGRRTPSCRRQKYTLQPGGTLCSSTPSTTTHACRATVERSITGR